MTGHTGGDPDYCPRCRVNPPQFPQCPGPQEDTVTDTDLDFDGCRRACRLAGHHTLTEGCEHAPEPEPTVSISHVYIAGDGQPALGFDTYTAQQLADLIEPALHGEESAELARAAANRIVNRHTAELATR